MRPIPSGISATLCAAGILLAGALPAAARQPADDNGGRKTMRAERLADGESIVLDGRLDEAVWSRAVPAAGFVQIDPINGQPPTELTEVRIAFDRDTFYMGVTAFDSDPDGWLGFQRRRDEFLGSDDRFMWTIDTFLDARSGYFFEMNPSGLMADSLFGVNGDNRAWDGIWNARVHHSEIGWTIEIEIPFRTLNFNPNSDTWGINFQRTVRRKNEETIWTGWARNQGLRRMTNAGLVTGIRDVTQGRGLDIKPYGLVAAQSSPGAGEGTRTDADAGLDLFYNPNPFIRANLTVNTDFAQTEVDQRQVNLTRFSLFFPERRDFFLDGAIYFDFASNTAGANQFSGSGNRVIPFFSRRIGLSANATPQKVDYGSKVMGQMGGQDVGLLHVRTGDDEGLPGEDFTVARVKRRLLQQSYVGALYTRRDPRLEGGASSHTAGIDLVLATSSFLGSQNLSATGWFLHAARPGVTGGNNAYGVTVDYPNDRWSGSLDIREVQEQFNPAVGFVNRRGYRSYLPSIAFGPRPSGHRYIRRFEFGSEVEIITDPQNRLLERTVDLTLLNVQFHSQDNFAVAVEPTRVVLDEPFEISDGIILPVNAAYDFTRFSLRGQTANRRLLAVNTYFETGGFYSGSRRQTNAGLTVRLAPGYILSFNGEFNQVKLAEGAFDTSVYRIVGETQFTPWIAIVNNVQYDDQSAILGWQSRFRWILTPGNDLYVVYTHNWLDDPVRSRFSTLERRAASKVLYTYRF
jgi:hypothetical protein